MSVGKELSKYLSSVYDLYPSGIPVRCLEDEAKAECEYRLWGADPKTAILFVGVFSNYSLEYSGRDGELLVAAVTKGLKLPLSSVSVLALAHEIVDPAFLTQLVYAIESELTPASICFLGEGLGKQVHEDLAVQGKQVKGKYMSVHRLESVLESSKCKREFWNHLQQLQVKY